MDSHLWKHCPIWFSDPLSWPPDIILPTAETIAEANVNGEILSVAIPKHEDLDYMLSNQALPLEHGCGGLFTTVEIRQEPERRVQSVLTKYSIKSYGGSKGLETQLTSSPLNFQADKVQLNLYDLECMSV